MKTAGMMAAVLVLSVGMVRAQENPAVRGDNTKAGMTVSAGQKPSLSGDGTAPVADDASEDKTDSTRVVRLSQLRGQVLMDRNTGAGFEFALANLPIVEGNKLQTTQGFAEAQLEDGSTLRLAPETEIEFTKLNAKDLLLTVTRGSLYVSMEDQSGPVSIAFKEQVVTPAAGSHLRLDVEADETKLVVFDGSARSAGSAGPVEVSENSTLFYTPKSLSSATPRSQGFAGLGGTRRVGHEEKGPFDKWDRDEIKYAKKYGKNGSAKGVTAAYGSVDLNYYGAFFDDPACGTMWRPYLVGAAWSPFDTGLWMWSPVASDYMWVSLYPWGWLPYHSGAWEMCGSRGWAWRPGRRFVPIVNRPARLFVTKGPGRPGRPQPPVPRPPVHPPKPPMRQVMLLVGRPVGSTLTQARVLTLRKDSAGMGIIRGSVRLDKVSPDVIQNGAVSRTIGTRDLPRVVGIPAGRESRDVMMESWRQRQEMASGGGGGAPANGMGRGPEASRGYEGSGARPGTNGSNNTARTYEGSRGSSGNNNGGSRPASGNGFSGGSRPSGGNSGGYNGGGGSRPSGGNGGGGYNGGGSRSSGGGGNSGSNGGGNSGGARPSGGGGGYSGGGYNGGGGGGARSAPVSAPPPPPPPPAAPAPAPAAAPAGHR